MRDPLKDLLQNIPFHEMDEAPVPRREAIKRIARQSEELGEYDKFVQPSDSKELKDDRSELEKDLDNGRWDW